MTATTQVVIDDDVALLREQIDGLRELGQRTEVDEDRVYDLSIRWGAAMAGRLRRLVYYRSCGLMDTADEARFAQLCSQLRAVADLVERFGLARPDLPDA